MTKYERLYVSFLEILSQDVHPTLKFIRVYHIILDAFLEMENKSAYSKNEIINKFLDYLNETDNTSIPKETFKDLEDVE